MMKNTQKFKKVHQQWVETIKDVRKICNGIERSTLEIPINTNTTETEDINSIAEILGIA